MQLCTCDPGLDLSKVPTTEVNLLGRIKTLILMHIVKQNIPWMKSLQND